MKKTLVVVLELLFWIVVLAGLLCFFLPAVKGQSLMAGFTTNFSRTNLTGVGTFGTNFSRTNLFGTGIFSTNFSRTNLTAAGFGTNASINVAAGITFAQAYQRSFLPYAAPQIFYNVGCSTSVRPWTNGYFISGGVTNQYAGRQANGALFYTNVTLFAANSLFWGDVAVGILASNGVTVSVDNDICTPGERFSNIIDGAAPGIGFYSWQNDTSALYFSATNYSAGGAYTNSALFVGNRNYTFWRDSSNDISVTCQGTNYTCAVGTNVSFFVVGGAYSYVPGILFGRAGSNVTTLASADVFAGGQNGYPYPHKNNGDPNSAANALPISWLYTNAPSVTGIPAGVFNYDPQNDLLYIHRPALIPYLLTNYVACFAVEKALAFYPRIAFTTPLTINFNGASITEMLDVNQRIRSGWTNFADGFVDLAAIYASMGITQGVWYVDNTHDSSTGANLKAAIVITNVFGKIKPTTAAAVTGGPANISSATYSSTAPGRVLVITTNVVFSTNAVLTVASYTDTWTWAGTKYSSSTGIITNSGSVWEIHIPQLYATNANLTGAYTVVAAPFAPISVLLSATTTYTTNYLDGTPWP